MKEVEVGEILVDWLESQGWVTYHEVQFEAYGRIADVVAVREDKVWFIELKTSFTMKVMEQALKWQHDAHYVSVAVPSARSRGHFPFMVAEKLGLGVIIIDEHYVSERVKRIETEARDDWIERKVKPYLTDLHREFCPAGSKSGHLTPYAFMMSEIKDWLVENPESTVNEIIEELGIYHYAHKKSAKGAISRALNRFEDWADSRYGSKGLVYFVVEDE